MGEELVGSNITQISDNVRELLDSKEQLQVIENKRMGDAAEPHRLAVNRTDETDCSEHQEKVLKSHEINSVPHEEVLDSRALQEKVAQNYCFENGVVQNEMVNNKRLQDGPENKDSKEGVRLVGLGNSMDPR